MLYAQIKNGEFVQEFGQELVRWDADNYCSAEALVKDGKADLFGVVPLQPTEPPAFDPITQRIERAGAELLSGQWQYKWSVIGLYATQSERQAAIDAHLAAICAEKWEAIKTERERRKAGGVKVNVDATVGDKWFHSDDASRIQQIGLVMMGANIPAGLQWKTMDGSFVTMTQALANAIFNAAASLDQVVFAKAEDHKTAMEAAANPATYDFTQDAAKTKWPVIFGE